MQNPTSLKQFLVCTPIISDLCKDFEEGSLNNADRESVIHLHHAESPYMQHRFLKDITYGYYAIPG